MKQAQVLNWEHSMKLRLAKMKSKVITIFILYEKESDEIWVMPKLS